MNDLWLVAAWFSGIFGLLLVDFLITWIRGVNN